MAATTSTTTRTTENDVVHINLFKSRLLLYELLEIVSVIRRGERERERKVRIQHVLYEYKSVLL